MSVLEDVVALVCCADAVRNARQAIQARLREHGARVVQRLSKDVSHVVFERKHVPPSAKRAEPDADLLELYTKLDKVRVVKGEYCFRRKCRDRAPCFRALHAVRVSNISSPPGRSLLSLPRS